MIEKWSDVIGFEKTHQISNYGRIKSKSRIVNSSISVNGKRKTKERILKFQIIPCGYYHIAITINGKTNNKYIHRMVAEAFIPNPLNKKEVNHIDGNKLNNRTDNLEWATRGENSRHGYEIGLTKHGEAHHWGKLKNDSVQKVRQLYKDGMYQKDIAKIYSISQATVSQIIAGKSRVRN